MSDIISQDKLLRSRLENFYSLYDRKEIANIPDLVVEYRDRELELFKQLTAKYGPEPPLVPNIHKIKRPTSADPPAQQPPSQGPRKSFMSSLTSKSLFTKQQQKQLATEDKQHSFAVAQENRKLNNSVVVRKGNAFGWIRKFWDTLDKSKDLFYILDFERQTMYEFESSADTTPRNVLSLKNARLGDQFDHSKTLFCWAVFIRSEQEGKAPKICKFGVDNDNVRESWIDAISKSVRPASVGSLPLLHSSSTASGQAADAADATTQDKSEASSQAPPSVTVKTVDNAGIDTADQQQLSGSNVLGSPTTQELNPTVIIGARKYNLRCALSSTNAWLMSEAIRVYLRENNNQDPGIIKLFNCTTNKEMELSEDVKDSFTPGDIIEAITDEADPGKTKLASPIPSPKRESSAEASESGHKPPAPTVPISKWYRKYRSDSAHEDVLDEDELRNVQSATSHDIGGERLKNVVSPWNSQRYRAKTLKRLQQKYPTDVYQVIETLINSSNAVVPFWVSDDWYSYQINNELRIFKSYKSPTNLLTMALIPASPAEVLDCIIELDKQHNWDPTFNNGKLLEIGQFSDVAHITHKPSQIPLMQRFDIPLLPRDFCIARSWERFQDGSFMLIFTPHDHPCCKTSPNMHVRGRMKGGYIIHPIEIVSGAEYSVVMYMCDVDFRGWVPQARQYMAQVQYANALAGIREYIACSLNEI